MQLEPGERSILAYFRSSDDAQRAAEELKNLSYENVQVDRISRYGVNHDDEYNNPIMGRAETITGLTLYSANFDRFVDSNGRVLLSSDPSVSGFAGVELAGEESFLVAVVTGDAGAGPAENVLRKHGGKFF